MAEEIDISSETASLLTCKCRMESLPSVDAYRVYITNIQRCLRLGELVKNQPFEDENLFLGTFLGMSDGRAQIAFPQLPYGLCFKIPTVGELRCRDIPRVGQPVAVYFADKIFIFG